MKKALTLVLAIAYFMIPTQVLAEIDTNQQETITVYVNKICSITNWKPDDIHLLVRVINAEARGEPYTGKVAVAAVIINRLKSPLFPNTLREIIMHPHAFTCIEDGQLYLTPDVECYKAALDAAMGYDPTGGCLFYYNPRTATSRWMKERKAVSTVVIGNHVFMKWPDTVRSFHVWI